MAKKRKPARRKPAVTLPPFPWETHAMLNGKRVRMARPEIEEADVMLDCERGADGEVVARRARVWRTALPPILKTLTPAGQAAMLDYAEVLERCGSSGGTSDPTGGGGGGGGARSPSLSALMAAERLGQMHAVLDGREMVVALTPRTRNDRTAARACYRDIARWVAVDGAGRREILKRMGAPASSEAAQDRCTLAIAEVAELLAICCGYTEGPTENTKSRNTRRPRV